MFCRTLIFLFFCTYFCIVTKCEESPNYFLKSAKNVPRIGRSNKGHSDFEKFFLKASKSVPRIGRRNENPYLQSDGNDKDLTQNAYKYPTWSEIADRYEYDPEIFTPEYLSVLEQEMGDDANVYEWDKVRMKRKSPSRFGFKPKAKQMVHM